MELFVFIAAWAAFAGFFTRRIWLEERGSTEPLYVRAGGSLMLGVFGGGLFAVAVLLLFGLVY